MISSRYDDGSLRFQNMQDEEVVVYAKGGSQQATEHLLAKYRGMVESKARSYFLMGADHEDVVQEGMIGLFKAIRDFREDKLTKFRPFAELCVTRQGDRFEIEGRQPIQIADFADVRVSNAFCRPDPCDGAVPSQGCKVNGVPDQPCQGTDGDDFDNGKEAIPEIEKILGYVNRMGACVLKSPYYGDRETEFEKYVKKGNFTERKEFFRMHVMKSAGITEEDNIKAVEALIAQD